jgi:hypothetical protein
VLRRLLWLLWVLTRLIPAFALCLVTAGSGCALGRSDRSDSVERWTGTISGRYAGFGCVPERPRLTGTFEIDVASDMTVSGAGSIRHEPYVCSYPGTGTPVTIARSTRPFRITGRKIRNALSVHVLGLTLTMPIHGSVARGRLVSGSSTIGAKSQGLAYPATTSWVAECRAC